MKLKTSVRRNLVSTFFQRFRFPEMFSNEYEIYISSTSVPILAERGFGCAVLYWYSTTSDGRPEA